MIHIIIKYAIMILNNVLYVIQSNHNFIKIILDIADYVINHVKDAQKIAIPIVLHVPIIIIKNL